MSSRSFTHIAIKGVASAVPDTIRFNNEIKGDSQKIGKTAKSVGIEQRYIVPNDCCTSDLCFAAADALLDQLNWSRDSVDALIFVSQTPDYILPATSCILQHRLGLSTACAAFDMSLGCSGYIYGLMVAFGLISKNGIKRVLLLVGDTISKVLSTEDAAANVLFGDAGTATAIEFDEDALDSHVVLGTDGSGYKSLIIEAGGFRNRATSNTKISMPHPKDQVVRSAEDLYMDGSSVFSFTLARVPTILQDLLKMSMKEEHEIDYWLFHQANKFIIDYLIQKSKIDPIKVPSNISRYGNTSPPSLPLLITTEGKKIGLDNQQKLVGMAGFGVGLSWGGALVQINQLCIPDLIFVNTKE